ncbi:MAG: helix-turn-helix domain-containing protein [bacterium]|nr:helix-turn-helix domain-containing protein [bacterium]
MTKYWNPERLRRIQKRKIKAIAHAADKEKTLREQQRTYTRGDTQKNANLMLNALGLPLRRNMVARLRVGGAMSLSKLVEPFNITLPSALAHLRILERAGIVATHKKGRIRICVYNRHALKELAAWLVG